jgi:AraC-like DNA-binding protein
VNNLFIVAAFQAFFFAFLILTKKNKSLPEYLLAAYFLANSLVVFNFYYLHEYVTDFPHFIGWGRSLLFLPGPLLYWYTRLVVGKRLSATWIVLHFAPFILYNLIYLPFHLLPAYEKLHYDYRYPLISNPVFEGASAAIKTLMYFGYHGLVVYSVVKHKKDVKNTFSVLQQRTLGWLIVAGIGAILFGVLSIIPYLNISETGYSVSKETPVFIVYSIFIMVVGYFGYKQKPIGTDDPMVHSEHKNISDETPRYQRSGLTQEMATGIRKQITDLMESEKIYLNPDLTVYDLSKASSVPAHHITEVLNQHMNISFYEFINNYRVDEAKRLLRSADHRQFTLEVIGRESGFNSRSTFYNYFKKATGMTPLAFQKMGAQD